MEYFDLIAPLQIHASQTDERIFEGLASVFGSPVMAWMPTKIDKGAFSKTLRENGSRVILLNQHDVKQPIGKPLVLKEVDSGLYLKGKLSKTQIAGDVWTLMKDGVLDGLSIGFNPISSYNKTIDGKIWRHLTDLELLEISCVSMPADASARITATHGYQMFSSAQSREAQYAEMKRQFDQLTQHALPNFQEVFGDGWIR